MTSRGAAAPVAWMIGAPVPSASWSRRMRIRWVTLGSAGAAVVQRDQACWRKSGRVRATIAVPVIAAGLRVAAVSNVSMVAVAATIRVPERGQLFTTGFQLSYFPPIIIGIVLCVALALVYDTLIVIGTRLLTPWRRAVKPS